MKYIHPRFRKPKNFIGINLIAIAAIIGFHSLQDDNIPDWLFILKNYRPISLMILRRLQKDLQWKS